VYLYDDTGAELNYLQKHIDPTRLEFLRYHFLLASIGNSGYLRYQVRQCPDPEQRTSAVLAQEGCSRINVSTRPPTAADSLRIHLAPN
jgi:hypothetical protein